MDLCLKRKGAFKERVRKDAIRFEEVIKRNDAGECLIYVDGMVFDITRWLPQHPGGNRIIPKQALNKDATRFVVLFVPAGRQTPVWFVLSLTKIIYCAVQNVRNLSRWRRAV